MQAEKSPPPPHVNAKWAALEIQRLLEKNIVLKFYLDPEKERFFLWLYITSRSVYVSDWLKNLVRNEIKLMVTEVETRFRPSCWPHKFLRVFCIMQIGVL